MKLPALLEKKWFDLPTRFEEFLGGGPTPWLPPHPPSEHVEHQNTCTVHSDEGLDSEQFPVVFRLFIWYFVGMQTSVSPATPWEQRSQRSGKCYHNI